MWREKISGLSRRDLFRNGGVLAALGFLPGGRGLAARYAGADKPVLAAPALALGPSLYESIGVKPLINCKGTFTIISASLTMPDVKKAMDEASRHYVQIDELMEAVAGRLAEITQAEWAIVTAGCSAAVTHATAACVAGADPEKMQRVPNLGGMKSEVIMPRNSRNVYDHAIRMTGARIIEVETKDEFLAALSHRTAMVALLAGPADTGPLRLEEITPVTRPRGIPILVDAAAEDLTIPCTHLKRGATMAAYSGGKCIRGPQCAGLLLGPKDLLHAAWLNSAPHHAFGRSMKVGKEEIMGMLAAVETWARRDHEAEWKTWNSWLAYISEKASKVPSVKTEVLQPEGLSNHSPRLRISWDVNRVGIAGDEVEKILFTTDPRIVLGGSTGAWRTRGSEESSITIMPFQMQPGDEKIAAARIYEILSHPPQIERKAITAARPAGIAGQWAAKLEFVYGSADHMLYFEQDGAYLIGSHRGQYMKGDLKGSVEGNEVRFRSSFPYEGTRLFYSFEGRVDGDKMSGAVDLDEYGKARWTAERHQYVSPEGVILPRKNV